MTSMVDEEGLPKLSDTEWEIMKPFWEKGPMAARDVFAATPKEFGWAYQTVKTMLARLVQKGALTYDQIGNSYLYRPVYAQADLTRAATRNFIKRVYGGSPDPFITYCCEKMTADQIRAIRRELDKALREKTGK